MSASSSGPAMRKWPLELDLPEGRVQAEVELPRGNVRLVEFAYHMQSVGDGVVELSERQVEKLGKGISCRKGCGACCRQLVPIAPMEASMLAEMVDNLPQGEREDVKRRFANVEDRVRQAGLWDDLWRLGDPSLSPDDHMAAAKSYFGLKQPCPFLVDEACSIHLVRPMLCREYLVVSPAGNCSSPFKRPIHKVPLIVQLSEVLARMDGALRGKPAHFVPLSLSLAWDARHPDARGLAAPADRLIELFMDLVGRKSAEARKREKEMRRQG